MDVRKIFKAASDKLMAEFVQSGEIHHQGGKGTLREDAFSDFLSKQLPSRYAVGRGEVINSENFTSGQIDLIIHDPFYCPKIVSSPSHSVFPIESVYGAISIKSNLNSTQLQEAYQNIESFHKIVIRKPFTVGGNGFKSGLRYPHPVTAVVAYKADRSLEAISDQIKRLDENIEDITWRPDFICVLEKGIIGPRNILRGDFNSFQLPSDITDLCSLRKTGRHTLLKVYLQLLREINKITLRPLDLENYENMPQIVGPFRVRRHDSFARLENDVTPTNATRLTKLAIQTIVEQSVEMTRGKAFEAWFGQPMNDPDNTMALDAVVRCFNPRHLPPISPTYMQERASGQKPSEEVFYPYQIEIDNVEYFVDFTSLPPNSFEENPDLTFDELMSG